VGFNDVSFNGGQKATKNLLKMSESVNSIVFSNFHSGSSMCSPSRAALLSGMYPDRYCVSGSVDKVYFQASKSFPSIAEDARRAGYSTLFLGKWHLSQLETNFIGRKGFDKWIATEGNILTYDAPCTCNLVKCRETSSKLFCDTLNGCTRKQNGNSVYCVDSQNRCFLGSLTLSELEITKYREECGFKTLEGGQVIDVEIPRNTMSCDFIVGRFEEYLSSLPQTEPFLAVLHFHESHIPFVADPIKRAQCEKGSVTCTDPIQTFYPNSREVNYNSVMESLDEAIGKIRRLLKDYDRFQNTLVLFSSDNGPENWEQGGAGSAYPLRGMKRSLFEGGHRVPAILEWPSRVRQNHIVNSLVSILDFRSTMLDILKRENLRFPSIPKVDGESLLGLISSPMGWKRKSPLLICDPVDKVKLIAGKSQRVCDSYAYFENTFKIISVRDAEFASQTRMLFDLESDKEEKYNLAFSHFELYGLMVRNARILIGSVLQDSFTYCGKSFVHPIP
jgi:arylsulfatase A